MTEQRLLELPLEIYRLVMSHIKAGETECGYLKNSTSFADQRQISTLMRVSKTLYERTLPSLYEDIVVDNFEAFSNTLEEAPRLLDRVLRLRVCHGVLLETGLDHGVFEAALLSERAGEKYKLPHHLATHGNPRSITKEVSGLCRLAAGLYRYEEEAALGPNMKGDDDSVFSAGELDLTPPLPLSPLLPLLERVVIEPGSTGRWSGNVTWPPLNKDTTYLSSLPLFLVNHPPVRHYCQQVTFSPLGLSSDTFEVPNPPEVVTIHIPAPKLQDVYCCHRSWLPTVCGTVNRYMFEETWIRVTPDNVDSEWRTSPTSVQDTRRALVAIVSSFMCGTVVLKNDQRDYCSVRTLRHLDPIHDDTTVEIYNFVDATATSPQAGSVGTMYRSETYTNELSRVQKMLDEMVSKNGTKLFFKGKLILKTAEEAPPCTACGMVLVEKIRSREATDKTEGDAGARTRSRNTY